MQQPRSSSSAHYDELVQDIGLKLRQLELKSGTTAAQQQQKAADAATGGGGLDPITKVSNWRQANPASCQFTGNNPSCYGSGSVDADSSAPTKTHNGEEEEDDSSDCSPPAGCGGGGGNGTEFDSGYPGSDRSGVNKTGRSGSLGLGGGRRTTLGNVLEEEVSAAARCEDETESSLPSEYAKLPFPGDKPAYPEIVQPPPPNIGVFHVVAPEDNGGGGPPAAEAANDDSLLQPPGRQHLRGVLHSITDLSSDERSMFDKSDRSAAGQSPHPLLLPRHPPPPAASSTPRSPQPQSALTTGRQPGVLAEQVGSLILEV